MKSMKGLPHAQPFHLVSCMGNGAGPWRAASALHSFHIQTARKQRQGKPRAFFMTLWREPRGHVPDSAKSTTKGIMKITHQSAIALLLTAMGGAALAQSNVTLYGLIDANVGSFKGSAAGVNALDRSVAKADSGGMSTSHFGLRGREELGSGVSLAFELSGFFRNDTGSAGRSDAIGAPVNVQADPFWARASWVGISSQDWGQLRLGNAATQLFVNSITSNAFGDSTVFSPLNLVTHIGAQQAGGTSWANQVIYDSPSFAGVKFGVAHGFSEGRGGNSSARVVYEQGAFATSLVWQSVKKTPITFADGTTPNHMKTLMLGGSYDFGAAKVFAHIGRIQNDGTAAVPQDVGYRVAEVSVAVPVGAGRILAGYALRKTSDTPLAVSATAAGGNVRRGVLTLAYDYQLSRRTDVYALVMNDKTRTLTLPAPLATVSATGTSAVVGIRHRF